jgi:hypothetical protein
MKSAIRLHCQRLQSNGEGCRHRHILVCEDVLRNQAAVSGESTRTSTGVPVVIKNAAGAGRAIYLNLDMHDYGRYRLQPPSVCIIGIRSELMRLVR